MMRRLVTSVYPFLLITIPVLHVAANHPGQASLDDLVAILAALLAGCAFVFLGVWLAVGNRWQGRLAPLAVLVAVLWFYGYGRAANYLASRLGPELHFVLVPLGLALTVGAGWWLLARPLWLDRLVTLLSLTGVLLLAEFGARIVTARWQSRERLRHSGLVRLSQPVRVQTGTHPTGPRRDVYLIILDEYANSSVTQEQFGFDNRLFEDSLRRLGFVIPRQVESNYLHTTLSLPSLLNAAHLMDLGGELGPHTVDPTIPNYLVENNRTVTFLKAQGYRFVFFPSRWWLSTRHNHNADLEFHAWPPLSARELSHTELRRSLRAISILGAFQGDFVDDVDHVARTFEGLARVPRLGGKVPTFVLAHVLKPHRPYAFEEHCRPRPLHVHGRRGRAHARGQGYVRQVHCVNSMVLRLVDVLLRTSAVPPIILLQGDHGTKTLGAPGARSVARVTPTAARERLGAFGAYYLPGGGAAEFQQSVTLVNVLGNVLRYYFGADLPRESDDMDLSVTRAPYVFHRVDSAWLASQDPPPAAKKAPRP